MTEEQASYGADLFGIDMEPVASDVGDYYGDKLAQSKAILTRFMAEAEALKTAVFALEIRDTAGSARASEYKATAQKIIKKIDAKVKEIIEEPSEYVQAVRNFGANLKAPLSEAKSIVDQKLSTWAHHLRIEQEKQQKAAREAAAKIQAQLDREAKKAGIEPVVIPGPVMPSAKVSIKTDSGTTYEVRTWKGKIVNPDLVPREYCSPDMGKIKAAVDGGIRDGIPGVEIFEQIDIRTRTK